MRTYQHVIDTKAVRQVINAIPEHCVIRSLSERDYGIDLMIELFVKTGINKHRHEYFDSSGHICYLQIKGTDKPLKINRDRTISCSIEKKLLLYAEKFPTPIILARVSVAKGRESIYFLWLQRYISDVLDVNFSNWRTDKSESKIVYVPVKNKLPKLFSKIEKIAWRIKYIEELAEFHETYTELTFAMKALIVKQKKYEFFNEIVTELRRLLNLSTLLNQNNCCIDKSCIEELIKYIEAVRSGKKSPREEEDFPHNFNLELLRTSNGSTRFIESLEAQNEGRTIY